MLLLIEPVLRVDDLTYLYVVEYETVPEPVNEVETDAEYLLIVDLA